MPLQYDHIVQSISAAVSGRTWLQLCRHFTTASSNQPYPSGVDSLLVIPIVAVQTIQDDQLFQIKCSTCHPGLSLQCLHAGQEHRHRLQEPLLAGTFKLKMEPL